MLPKLANRALECFLLCNFEPEVNKVGTCSVHLFNNLWLVQQEITKWLDSWLHFYGHMSKAGCGEVENNMNWEQQGQSESKYSRASEHTCRSLPIGESHALE